MKIGETLIEDTFAEGFGMGYTRLWVTAHDEYWLDAALRELHEEIGLQQQHVEIIASSRDWLRYRLPEHLIRHESKPLCIGQKQRWFLLRLTGEDQDVCLDKSSRPEFDHWRWVEYWHPLKEVVSFKRDVYESALREFESVLF